LEVDLLDLPFDHFERHALTKAIVDHVRELSGSAALRILDVGGAAASLGRFLPDDNVIALDLDGAAGASFVRGAGTDLPFRDSSFELVTCHDTLEHVPPGARQQFVNEMMRVASRLVVVSGPFCDPLVEAAEELVINVARKTLGSSCDTVKFLNEHAYYGLPSMDTLLEWFKSRGFATISVASGALDQWLVKMVMKHHLSALADFHVQAHEFDRWCNSRYRPIHEEGPTYRHVIVGSKGGDAQILRALAKRLDPVGDGQKPGTTGTLLPVSMDVVEEALAWFSELVKRELREKDEHAGRLQARLAEVETLRAEVQRLRQELSDKMSLIQEQDDQLAQRDLALARAQQEIEAIRSSAGYRILEGYRRLMRSFFPPGSWRGLPYRAARGGARWLWGSCRRAARLLDRARRARDRHGAVGAVLHSVSRIGIGHRSVLDPVAYALSVDWAHYAGSTRPPEWKPNMQHPIVNWVIPTLGEGGGHRTIFRLVELLGREGFHQRIYEMPVSRPPRASPSDLRRLIRRYFGLDLKEVYLDFESMQPADVTVATSWHTAYPVAKFADTWQKCYLVQDFEPLFTAAGTESALAENTYRFGFHGITAGRWLSEKLSTEFGMDCDHFDLAVDSRVYYPKDVGPRRKIFFYARPATPRRGFELGVRALELFHLAHPEYEVVMAGGDVPYGGFPFPVTNVGYVPEERLNELYNSSAAALVISLTNCSLLPMEIMATGCPVVTTCGANNEKVLPANTAILAVPSPYHLAKALEEAVKRPMRPELVEVVRAFSWDDQARKVASVLRRLLSAAAV